MPMLDVFNTDAFGVISMSAAIQRMPYVPSRIGSLGLFNEVGIATTVAAIEYAAGRLQLLQTSQRGAPAPNRASSKGRKLRTFKVPHVKNIGEIFADDVLNIRAFGSETELEAVASLVNDKIEQMRAAHEITHEYHRAGAICGVILDADGSEIYNLFDEFGLTEDTYTLSLASDAGELKVGVREIIRDIENELGAIPYKGIHALCDDTFYDNLLKSAGVAEAYDRWQDGQFRRDQQGRDDGGFTYLGVTWENYRGKVDSTTFLQGTNVARFFPTGVKDLFQTIVCPADYMETVGTKGKLLYAKQAQKPFDRGVDLESQSNALFMCTMPGVLKKVTFGA